MPMKRAEDISQTVAQLGGGTAVISSWLIENNALLSSIGILVGIGVGLVGLGFNVYFGWRRAKFAEIQAKDSKVTSH